jgi:hypothetical protein
MHSLEYHKKGQPLFYHNQQSCTSRTQFRIHAVFLHLVIILCVVVNNKTVLVKGTILSSD